MSLRVPKYITNKVGVQIILSFVLVIFFSIGSFIAAFLSFASVREAEQRLANVTLPKIDALNSLNTNLLTFQVAHDAATTSNRLDVSNAGEKLMGQLDQDKSSFLNLPLSDGKSLTTHVEQIVSLSSDILNLSFNDKVMLLREFSYRKQILLQQIEDAELTLKRSIIQGDEGLSGKSPNSLSFADKVTLMKNIIIQVSPDTSTLTTIQFQQAYRAAIRDITLELSKTGRTSFKRSFGTHISQLFAEIELKDNIFQKVRNVKKIDKELLKKRQEFRFQNANLNNQIVAALSNARQYFDEDSGLLTHRIETNFIVFVAGILISVCGALVIIIFYVYPHLIARIRNLAEATHGITTGLLETEINTEGSDEISELGKSLNYFREREIAAQQAREFQKLILENIPDYIFTKDDQYRIVQANGHFLNLYPAEIRNTVFGTTTLESYNQKEAEDFLKFDKLALDEGKSETEESIMFPDGRKRTLFTKKVRFTDRKGARYILGVSRDITKIKETEQALIKSNEELDDFAFIASHDLKEPLRGIYNHARFLMEDYEEQLDEDGRHKLNRLVYLAKYMETLISDLLYYSRLGRTDGNMQLVDLNVIVEETSNYLMEGNDGQIDVVGSLPTVKADRTQMLELFRNIITNGLKYNESKIKIITIEYIRSGAGHITGHDTISIKDNGIGIDERFHDEIFKIFKRLHRKDAYGGGTGSGLTFVRKILDKHNGSLQLNSSLGNGSEFLISLPHTISKN